MSQTAANTSPFWRYKNRTSKSWTTTGNTDTITDAGIKSNSYVVCYVYGSTPAAGRWAVAVTTGGGSAVVTSSDSESAGLTYHYIIL